MGFRGFIAGSPPWEPLVEERGTADWPGPPGGLDCCLHPPPRSSAQLNQRPSGRSPGCRDSGGTQSCLDLKQTNTLITFLPFIRARC